MKIRPWTLPVLALSLCAGLVASASNSSAFTLQSFSLDLTQRDFRIFNNFADATANDNQTPDANFPGHQGAVMAIWKASVEWSSDLHGDGNGDPHQPGGLGSGGANFDVTFQGEAPGVGGINDNIHSAISSAPGGVIAYTEGGAGGWRIRYNDQYVWDDGPGTTSAFGALDLQGVATRQYGFALGLGNSSVSGATMSSSAANLVELRSIEADDAAGVQAIYGVRSALKPKITSITVAPTQVSIFGQNFSVTGNEVWFTNVKVVGVPSNGSLITIPIPVGAGSGDVLVRNALVGAASLSNPWPLDLGTPCITPQNYCSSSPNSVGPGAAIGNTGTTSVSAADLVLVATGCPPNHLGLFFYGPDQVDQPFGEGRLCVGAPLSRLPVVSTDVAGTATHAIDYNAAPIASGPGQVVPGGEWNFQFWYRDPSGGPAGFNTSDGLHARFCP